MNKEELKEQVRTVAHKKISESVSGKKEQLNEFIDPISLGLGVVAGMTVFYTGMVAKRKMNELGRKMSNFFKDPFGTKRKFFEKMVKDLQMLIEKRDVLLSRGDDTSVRELREAESLTRQIVTHATDMKNFLNDNMDALEVADNKKDFAELMSLLNSASSGEMTFMDLKDTSYKPAGDGGRGFIQRAFAK